MSTVNPKDEVVIVLSADDNYAPYLAATLVSLAEHSSPVRNYMAYILTEGRQNSCNIKPTKECSVFSRRTWSQGIDHVFQFGVVNFQHLRM